MTPLVISLGNDCTTAYQLKHMGMFDDPGSPFDWLVTPFSALLKVLEDSGSSFGMEFQGADGWNVLCERYGVIHVHDFPKTPEGRLRFSAAACQDVREKMLHKYNKMVVSARIKPSLFVRYRGHGGPTGESISSVFSNQDADRLFRLIYDRIGHDQFRVLLINPSGRSAHYKFDGRIEVSHPAFVTAQVEITPETNTFLSWPAFQNAVRVALAQMEVAWPRDQGVSSEGIARSRSGSSLPFRSVD